MSDHDEVMERLDWLVKAVKYLLRDEAPVVSDPVLVAAEDDDPEIAGVVEGPPIVRCTHQHQRLERGNIVCAKCGALLQAMTGIKQQGQSAPWDKDHASK